MTHRVIASSVNLRSAPSASAPLVDVLPEGTLLERVGSDAWVYVRTSLGARGWVVVRHIEEVDNGSREPGA